MAVLRVTGLAMESIVTRPVYHLRSLPSLAPCRLVVWPQLPFLNPHLPVELPFETSLSCLKASLRNDRPSSGPVASFQESSDGVSTSARLKQPPLCRLTLIHGGASLVDERALSTHSHFLCRAASDGAEVSEKLPVGLVLPSAEPAHEPVTLPQVTEDMVELSFARSGGAGGQNVNKVNTKVDMRFNVLEAPWLPDWVKEKLLEQEANRINNDGELVVTSTRTRTQKGNIEDALEKLNAILSKASYVAPPPSAEKIKRIKKLAKAANQKRLDGKKKLSSKKADRRNKGKWDD